MGRAARVSKIKNLAAVTAKFKDPETKVISHEKRLKSPQTSWHKASTIASQNLPPG
jgi:hypothetical protein